MAINHVFEANTFTAPSDAKTNIDDSGTVTVEQDAFIVGTGDNGLEFTAGPNKIKVDGYIDTNFNGMALYDVTSLVPNATLTVGAEGVILGGAGFSGVSTALAMDITNSGTIQGGDWGIKYAGINHSTSKAVTITNNAGAEIRGGLFGIELSDANHDLILKNAGIIDEVVWGRGSKITNSGTIEDLAEASSINAYDNTLINSGTINQNFTGGHGKDVVTNTGTIKGFVSLIDGDNILTNSGTIGSFVAGTNDDDTFTNTKIGNISGTVDLGNGTNKLTNAGTIGDDVTFGTGNNTLANSGSIDGKVTMAGGTDQVTNTGLIDGNVEYGLGINKLTNGGHITGSILGDVLADTYTNTGTIGGTVELGEGNNKITNSGSIGNDLTAGGGNDVIISTGNVLGEIRAGAGDDKVTCGNERDQVSDGGGNDVIAMGGGNDSFSWSPGGHDTADGGAGFDQFGGTGATGVLLLNADTKAVTLPGHAKFDASTANVLGDTVTIKGFEEFFAGSFSDVLCGSAAKESFFGNGGADTFYGAGGADHLDGGTGNDTFVYLSIKDSGPTKVTRDVIDDFEHSGSNHTDVIDLSAIDADSKSADHQHFRFLVGTNQEFQAAGDLRVVQELGNTIVQADTNGDGKVDFSIELTGIVNLTAADFVL